MKKYRKYISTALIAVMTASVLAGCSGGSSSGSSGTADGETGTVETIAADSKGRYVETDLGNPFTTGGSDTAETGSQPESGETVSSDGSTYTLDYNLWDMTVLKDGTLRAIVSNYEDNSDNYNDNPRIYSSDDNGKTWTDTGADFSEIGGFISESSDDGTTSTYTGISNVSIDGDGNVFLDYSKSVSDSTSGDTTDIYYLMSPDGKFTEKDFEIPGVLKQQHYEYTDETYAETSAETETDDGIVINESGSDENGQQGDSTSYINAVKLVDADHLYVATESHLYLVSLSDNKIIKDISGGEDDYISNIIVCGDKIISAGYNHSYSYDISTGENQKEIKGLSKLMTSARSTVVFANDYSDSGKLYYADSDGIFEFDTETGNSRQIVDGALTSLIDPNITCSNLEACKDGSFLINAQGSSNTIYQYTYDENMAARPDKNLKIYALSDTYVLRQVAAGFQKANPDVYVSYEFGMTGDDAVTASDAVRTLNTEIMGGEGPDIILLDGMSIDDYTDKGVLADISDVVEPLVSDGTLFGNQAETYKKDDGTIPAVPMTFSYPMMVGEKDVVDDIKTIPELADAAEKFASGDTDGKTFLQAWTVGALPATFIPVCNKWYNDDGSLNTDQLKTDVEAMRRIYKASYDLLSDDDKSSVDSQVEYYKSDEAGDMDISTGSWSSDPSSDALYIIGGVSEVSIGYMNSVDGLQNITSAMRDDKNFTYTTLPGSDGNVYVPNYTIGINAKTKDMDTSKAFLTYLLGEDAQTAFSQQYAGFCLNKKSFDKSLENPYKNESWFKSGEPISSFGTTTEDGKEITLDVYWPSDDEIKSFKESVSQLDTPSNHDSTVQNTIFKDIISYVSGEGDIDSVMDQIQKDVQIYLSE